MKHSAQRRRGWKSEAEIHQTGTEPHNVKKCQSYFQQSDNCGDILSVREEEKGLSSQETGDPMPQCRGVSHPSDSKGLWEQGERSEEESERRWSPFSVLGALSCISHGASTQITGSLERMVISDFTLSHSCQARWSKDQDMGDRRERRPQFVNVPKTTQQCKLPLQLFLSSIVFWALLSVFIKWECWGSLLSPPFLDIWSTLPKVIKHCMELFPPALLRAPWQIIVYI